MDKRIVWETPSGEILFTSPAPASRHPEENEQDWLDRVAEIVKAKSPEMLGRATRHKDEIFDDLWAKGLYRFRTARKRGGDGELFVDMPLARVQRMGEIRDGYFPPFDAEWTKAMGQGNTAEAQRIDTQRQILRDIPQTINLDRITTPKALAEFQPEWPE